MGTFAEQILAGPEGHSARRRSIEQKIGGNDSTPENSAAFADQMFSGPQGRNARRQSRNSYRNSIIGKSGARSSCSISDSAKQMMDELTVSNRGKILADFEDDSDCEEELPLAAP